MSGYPIVRVVGRRVWDSRGRPTVEAEVTLSEGTTARAIAPAGASRGSGEAIDLRDGERVYAGFGVRKAVNNVNRIIGPLLAGMNASDQETIDHAMIAADGTGDKSRLGGNAMIAVSMAVLNAAAKSQGRPLWQHLAGQRTLRLPLPEIQIFGGGAHAGRRIDIQDIMAIPVGAETFDDALIMVAEVYRKAGEFMKGTGRDFGVADEGGWWPAFDSNEEPLQALVEAIEAAGMRPGDDIAISLDVAASEFGAGGRYRMGLDRKELDSEGMIELLGSWIDAYPVVSIEDPLSEDDRDGLKQFTRLYGHRIQVVGDDVLVTNAARIAEAANAETCNTALIKPNQAGTITETEAALLAAKNAGWRTIVSARSGETEDVTIAHLAVGWKADQIKVGSFARSERMAKWNEVLRISESLGNNAKLARL